MEFRRPIRKNRRAPISDEERISVLQLVMAYKQELSKDHAENSEKISACFKRIDELKDADIQLGLADNEIKTMFIERMAGLEKTLSKQITDLEKEVATRVAMATVIIGILSIVLPIILKKFFNL